jgi:hypothetical protein
LPALGVTGPKLSASGLPRDLRKTGARTWATRRSTSRLPTNDRGDAWGRFVVASPRCTRSVKDRRAGTPTIGARADDHRRTRRSPGRPASPRPDGLGKLARSHIQSTSSGRLDGSPDSPLHARLRGFRCHPGRCTRTVESPAVELGAT